MAMSAPRIVIGIDFGTTFSGVCWAIDEGQKKARVITDWPNQQMQGNGDAEKVPSAISFADGRMKAWGYDIGIRDDPLRWFKVLLEPDHKYAQATNEVKSSNALLNSLGKTVEDVVAQYLECLWSYTKSHIRKRIHDEDWEHTYDLSVVLTVPAIWSPVAKERTLKAARAAGLPSNPILLTEPEAAALATLHDKADDESLRIGESFVVCDAGGGTVVGPAFSLETRNLDQDVARTDEINRI